MDSELAIHTIRESCYRVGYPTYDAEHKRRILINSSCNYAIECIEKIEKIKQIVKKELSLLSYDEMSNAEIQIREILEQDRGKAMAENKRDKAERLITKYLVDNIIDPELPEALMLAIHDIRRVREIEKLVKE